MICPICGKEFIKTAPSRKYCSEECAHIAKKKNMTKARKTGNYITCPICNTKFKSRGLGRFCSEECKNAYYDKKPMQKVCIWCGKTFIPSRSNVVFCSDKCRKHRKDAEENPRYTSYEPGKNISDVARKARESGMSYGKYVEALERGIL